MNVGRGASLLLVGLSLAGCGGGDKPAKKLPTAEEPPGIKRREIGSLPAVGDYLPAKDNGRIEIAPASDWISKQTTLGQLASFATAEKSDLPRILVLSDLPPEPMLGDTTEDNVEELVIALKEQLARDERKVEEPPKPIILGETVFVRHVRLARYTRKLVVIQSLQTVQAGQLYTVDLLCAFDAEKEGGYEKALTKWRDHGYAVAANLKFHPPGGAPAPAAPG